MRAGPGAADAQGVYRYGEADNPDGSFSGLMDLTLESISDQFEADRVRLDALETDVVAAVNRSATAVSVGAAWSLLSSVWADVLMQGGALSPTRAAPNVGKLTVPVAGWYQIDFHLLASGAAADVMVAVKKNSVSLDTTGAVAVASGRGIANTTLISGSALVKLAGGDYLSMVAYASATIALNAGVSDVSAWTVRYVREP